MLISDYPLNPISDIANSTDDKSKFWLWTGIIFVALLLLEPEKRKPSRTPSDLHGLEGRIRSCDAWFEATDKKGRLIHRCFIYKPTCNAKRCKTDTQLSDVKNPYQEDFPFLQFKKQKNGNYKAFYSGTKDLYEINNVPINEEFESPRMGHRLMLYTIKPEIESLQKRNKIIPEQSSFIEPSQPSLFGKISGYTSTCLKFGKNKLGRRQCKKYAPTCGSADEGCRYDPIPVPGREGKRTQKDFEIEAGALAQELANEKNFELDFNKKLMRDILSYGGIAPHKSGFMSEEYRQIPKKYKRAEGVPMDELAQEMGTDESTLADQIYQAEASFQELKDMRGGKTAIRFKKTDFIDEAWNRMQSGRGFIGYAPSESYLKSYPKTLYKHSLTYRKYLLELQNKVLEYLDNVYLSKSSRKWKNISDREYLKNYENMHISEDESAPIVYELRNSLVSGRENFLLKFLKNHNVPGYDRLNNEFQNIKKGQYILEEPTKQKIIAEKHGQLTLFGVKFNPDITENQIRARVLSPKKISKGTYFTRQSTTPGVSYVMGQDNSGRVMTQSIRFDRNMYNNSQAKHWFDSNIKRIKQRDRQSYVYLSGGKTHSEDYFSPRQQEMFPGLRRKLVLEPEDNAGISTVDPLEACLERSGWDLRKVKKYQDIISAKLTSDMFGKTEKLTGSEVMLQEQIQKCLERR